MNEIEKAIQYCEHRAYCGVQFADGSIAYPYQTALSALRAQQERENPDSLTLDELWERDGKPVYCVWLDSQKAEWRILHVDEIGVSAENWQDALWDSQYGKTWLAYAHPPKEDKL